MAGSGSPTHDAAAAVGEGPAVEVACLEALVEDGLRDVGGLARGEQRQQLDLAAVDVPAGEVRVLDVPGLGAVDDAVHAGIAAVGVAEDAGVQEGVVERGVEDAALRVRPAADGDPVQPLVPVGAHVLPDRVVRLCLLLVERVAAGTLDVDEGDADPGGHRAHPGGEGDHGLARLAVGVDGLGEGLVEGGVEVEPVAVLGLAEGAAVAVPGERVGADVDRSGGRGERLGRVDAHGGRAGVGRRVGEAGDARALGGGEVGADAVVEGDVVTAGRRLLVGVGERGVRRRCGLLRGHEGDVAVGGAARSGDVREAEAADAVVAVGVAAVLVRHGVGAPLHPAERCRGAREGVARAAAVAEVGAAGGGADERVDVPREIVDGPGPGRPVGPDRGGGRSGRHEHRGRKHGPKQGKSHHVSPARQGTRRPRGAGPRVSPTRPPPPCRHTVRPRGPTGRVIIPPPVAGADRV